MTNFRRGFSRTPVDVFCSLAAPLSHDSAGGGGRQIALLDWFRKRTRSTPSGDDEVKLRAKTPQTVRKLQTSWPVSRDSYSFGQFDRAGHMTPLEPALVSELKFGYLSQGTASCQMRWDGAR
jgi:hypothetical protein